MYTQCFSTLICCGWANGSTLALLRLCRSGVDFSKIELSPSPSDVVMSWLRLQTHTDCIPHPCHMYTKCFSTLICGEWAYGCALTLLCLCRSGVKFRKIGVGQSLSDVVISWLRLQTCLECIPHPCHMYKQRFSTLMCCGWANWSTLALLRLCRSGVDFSKIELSPSPSDVVMSWLRLQTCLECIPNSCHMYTKCFSTLIRCGWAYGCALTLLCMCRSGVEFRKIGVGRSLSDVVMSWLRLQTHLECIPHPFHMYTKCFSFSTLSSGWAYGCTLTCYACAGREWILGKLG